MGRRADIDERLIRQGTKKLYPVNEAFYTVQGEGANTGKPAFFIRLQGCPVGCGWCDTKTSWNLNRFEFGITYRMRSAIQMADEALRHASRLMVLTGGEPLIHDCDPLIETFLIRDFMVQIETSGCFPLPMLRKNLYITVSPKFDMPGNFPVLEETLIGADEIKMPVGKQADIDKLTEALKPIKDKGYRLPAIFLQPLSQSKKATALCVEAAKQHDYRLSMQTHKYAEIP